MFRYACVGIVSVLIVGNFSCKPTTNPSSTGSPDGIVATKTPLGTPSTDETLNKKNVTKEDRPDTTAKNAKKDSNHESKEKVTQKPLPMGTPQPLTTPQGISSQGKQTTPQENVDNFKPAPLPGKGAKAVKKKPVIVKTTPTAPAPKTKIATLVMKPPATEHRYEIQLSLAERTRKQSFENKASIVESVRTSRDSRCTVRIAKIVTSGDKGKVNDFLLSLRRASWSAHFDKQGILKNIRTGGLSKSTGLMALGISEGGLGFLNILFPSREVSVGANWLYTLRMNDVLEGWFPPGVRIFGLDNTMIQFRLEELQEKNKKTYARISSILDYNADGRRKIGKEEKPMTIVVRSIGNAIVDTNTGLPETMSVQTSVYFTGADADKTITILMKSKKIK